MIRAIRGRTMRWMGWFEFWKQVLVKNFQNLCKLLGCGVSGVFFRKHFYFYFLNSLVSNFFECIRWREYQYILIAFLIYLLHLGELQLIFQSALVFLYIEIREIIIDKKGLVLASKYALFREIHLIF